MPLMCLTVTEQSLAYLALQHLCPVPVLGSSLQSTVMLMDNLVTMKLALLYSQTTASPSLYLPLLQPTRGLALVSLMTR